MFLLQRKVNDMLSQRRFLEADLSIRVALKHIDTLAVMLLARNLKKWGGAIASGNLSIYPQRDKNLESTMQLACPLIAAINKGLGEVP